MPTRVKNKQLNLFSDDADEGPFTIRVTGTGDVEMDLNDLSNGVATKELTMCCKEIVVKNEQNKKQKIVESLDLIEKPGVPPVDYLVNLENFKNKKRTTANFLSINDAFLWENNRAVDCENAMVEEKTVPLVLPESQVKVSATYTNINQAFLDESNRAIQRENSIVETRQASDTGLINSNAPSHGMYNNINQAFVDENTRAILREDSIIADKSKNLDAGISLDTPTDGTYKNINEAFVDENCRAVTRENGIVEDRSAGNLDLWENFPEIPALGNYKNINAAFVAENTRAVNRENTIVEVHVDQTVLPAESYKEVSIGEDSIEFTSKYLMKDTMDYTNINKAVLEEHRRAVTAENEINNRISSLLTGTTEDGLNSLQEIVSMFQNNDLTLSKNLQVFSTKYNALVNDFNTLSQSHKALLDRINKTFTTTAIEEPDYSDATQESIQFNTQTGLVNVTSTLNDQDSWDRANTSSTNGVWFVSTQTEGKFLILPQGENIQAGSSLIIRKVDKGPDPKPFKIQWNADGSSNITLENDGDEVVVLGLTDQWYVLKQP
tara:strand:+ start:681 stop:2333 length:1653 start_codon:yes stop_codon:yes gene_type:complete